MVYVLIKKVTPENVIEQYVQLLEELDYANTIKTKDIIIKLNLSWTLYYPSCSTAPWQLHGLLEYLKRHDLIKTTIAVENQTVVTNPWKGAYLNKWLSILEKYGVKFLPLTNEKWISYNPKAEMIVMKDMFGEVLVPEIYMGKNIIHLPTIKTHGHTTMTGSMKNAFGGLIPKYRHHAHAKIHEVLVDLLSIQKEIHPNILTLTDGCVCGDGAGPRTTIPKIGNIILGSYDSVAIDALSAKIMGFIPVAIDFLRIANEKKLGSIYSEYDASLPKLNFTSKKSPIIFFDQLIRKNTLNNKTLHKILFKSNFFKLFIKASEVYHDNIWYPTIGKMYINNFNKTEWGRLFASYEYGKYPNYDKINTWREY